MAQQRAVERSRLGAWLLKCNPELWDLRGLLDSGQDRLTSWAVQPGYRSRLVAPGDPVLFWVSGGGRQGLQRGIWGLGHTTAEVEPWAETEQGRWRSASASHGVRARVEIDVRLLDQPVSDDELRAAGIDGLEVQRQPFMANPSFVTSDQLAALRPLLPPWTEPPGTTAHEEEPR
ncbi:EVE domain-containing protein [Terrabacter sp. NPDC080008]|uniref:EVE domain-containing protein n=1 Tax=Terrabacter sp. NPDC080008 TaxID=3155176 RepID=UPI00344B96DD